MVEVLINVPANANNFFTSGRPCLPEKGTLGGVASGCPGVDIEPHPQTLVVLDVDARARSKRHRWRPTGGGAAVADVLDEKAAWSVPGVREPWDPVIDSRITGTYPVEHCSVEGLTTGVVG